MRILNLVFLINQQEGTVCLAVKKAKIGAGLLNGYGGKLEPTDASFRSGAVRELVTESGVVAKPEDLVFVATLEFFEDGVLKYLCHVYFLYAWQNDPKESGEMGPPTFVPLDEIPYEKMLDADGKWLRLLILGERFHARCWYDKGNKHCLSFEIIYRR